MLPVAGTESAGWFPFGFVPSGLTLGKSSTVTGGNWFAEGFVGPMLRRARGLISLPGVEVAFMPFPPTPGTLSFLSPAPQGQDRFSTHRSPHAEVQTTIANESPNAAPFIVTGYWPVGVAPGFTG